FARIDDRERVAYPGLALAVISGARPVVLRRVNYYEDFQFLGLFDPHPDHPFKGPQELAVGAAGAEKFLTFIKRGLVTFGPCSLQEGQMVEAGQPASPMLSSGTVVGHIKSPRAGMVS